MLLFFFYFGNNSAEDIIKKTAEEVIHSIRSPAIAYTISTFWLSGQASSAMCQFFLNLNVRAVSVLSRAVANSYIQSIREETGKEEWKDPYDSEK